MRAKKILGDGHRQEWLTRMIAANKNPIPYGKGLLPTDLITRAVDLRRPLANAIEKRNNLLAKSYKQVALCNDAIANLTRKIRDFWTILTARVRALNQPSLLKIYGLPLSGNRPVITRKTQVLAIAERLMIAGEIARDKGYPPVSKELTKRITNLLRKARIAHSRLTQTNSRHEGALLKLRGLRESVTKLAGSVKSWFGYIMRREKAADRREIMRGYGFSFEKDPKPKEADVPVAPETPRIEKGTANMAGVVMETPCQPSRKLAMPNPVRTWLKRLILIE